MKTNIGSGDRFIRISIAAAVAILYFTDTISGTLALILGIVAILLLLTSLVGFCPAYRIFGISTHKERL